MKKWFYFKNCAKKKKIELLQEIERRSRYDLSEGIEAIEEEKTF